jgi:nucleoid-associated protein YgaU
MGLFSFIKGAGSKLFGKKKAAPTAELTEEQKHINALKDEVARLNIPVDNLTVDIGQQVIVAGVTNTNADREKVILALGNVEGVGAVEDNIQVRNPEPESTFHEVKSGDTLSKIAKEVYGDPMRYQAIFEANKPMLTHPDKIYPGQILRIPQA